MNATILTTLGLLGNYNNAKELRDNFEAYLRKNFSKTSKIKNNHTGFNIGFNENSFKKLTSGKIGETKYIALTALENILRYGTLYSCKIDNKQRKDILLIYWFMCFVNVKGRKYVLRYSVRYTNDGKFIYSGHLNIKEKYPTE